MREDLQYAIETYTIAQVEPFAKRCKEKGCPSYINCFFGKPTNNTCGMPVCAQTILEELKKKEGAK